MNFEIKRGTSTFRKLAMRALSKPVDIVVVMKGGVGWWVGRMVGGGRSGLLIAPVVPTDNSYKTILVTQEHKVYMLTLITHFVHLFIFYDF